MGNNLSKLADDLKPYMVPWVRRIATAGSGASGAGDGGGGDMLAHVLATTSALGPFHTVSGLTAGQVLQATSATAAAFGILSHTQLSDLLTGDPHTQYALRSIDLTAGNGLTGGGTLAANRTFTLGTPGTLTYATTNAVTSTSHTHAITTNWDVSTVDSILQSSGGDIKVDQMIAVNSVTTPALISATTLTLTPGTYAILSDSKSLRTSTFVSGFAGSGFQLDASAPTELTIDNLWVRGMMHVYELLIHKIRATNGSIIVANTGKVKTRALVSGVEGAVSSVYGLYTDDETGHGFAVGDLIRAQKFTGTGAYQSSLEVTSVGSASQFGGTLISGVAPQVGYEYVRLGSTSDVNRRGGVYMTADDSGAPFIDIWNGVTAFTGTTGWGAAGTVKVRLGRLDGITSDTNVYGLWAGSQTLGNVYITGTKVALRQGSTEVITLASDGSSSFTGVMTIGTSGEIRQGTGTLGADYTGLRMWRQSNVGLIGGYNGNTLQWYGSTDGKFYAGGGSIVMDADGIRIGTGGSPTWTQTYGFSNASGTFGGVRGYSVAGNVNYLSLYATELGSRPPKIYIWADGETAYPGYVQMVATATGVDTTITVDASDQSVAIDGVATTITGTLGVTGLVTLTGKAAAATGSNTAASYAFVSDANTGMYSTGTDMLGLTVGGNVILQEHLDANDCIFRLGQGRTSNGAASLSLASEASAASPYYGVILIRNSGANGTTQLVHRGTGAMTIQTTDAAALNLSTSATPRLSILATGEAKFTNGVFAFGDPGGIAGYTGISATTAGVSSGGGTVKMNGITGRNSVGWIKMYVGTTDVWLPYWTTITG